MALSANERKQRQLARDHEARRRLPDSSYPFLTQPFHEWAEASDIWGEIRDHWEYIGVELPDFVDDRGPAEYSIHNDTDQYVLEAAFSGYAGSVGRAEFMADHLIEAGVALARSINAFKREELQKRLTALESEDLSDPDRRKAALAEGAQIAKLQDELRKNIRYTVPQWIVKGI